MTYPWRAKNPASSARVIGVEFDGVRSERLGAVLSYGVRSRMTGNRLEPAPDGT